MHTLETFLYQIKTVSLILKILSEGTFSRVVAQMGLYNIFLKKHWVTHQLNVYFVKLFMS